MNQVISLQDAVFVDNVIPFSVKQREKEIEKVFEKINEVNKKGDRK